MKRAIYILFTITLLVSCATAPPSPEVQELVRKAEAGDMESQFRLGALYDVGYGGPSSAKETEKWYKLAAEAGHSEAQNSLGSIYQAENRYKEALPWYEKSAAQNNALAINNLAYMYDQGLGVNQDRQKARQLYLKSANLGEAQAMYNLGLMYGSGQLGKQDPINACAWTFRALKYSSGTNSFEYKPASENAEFCKRTLNAKDYESARNLAESWKPSTTDQEAPNKNSNRTASPPVL
jgi:TPR repeat protein